MSNKKIYPKFSVLMSLYIKEKAEYFDQAMKSIWDNQSMKPDQIVLVEDGPLTPELYDMIKNWVNHTGSMLTFTSEGVWIGEFMSGDGFNQYFVYDIKTGKQTTYSKRKAILILAKQGIDDDYQPTIC